MVRVPPSLCPGSDRGVFLPDQPPVGAVNQVLATVAADGHGISKRMIADALPELTHAQIHESVDLLVGAGKLRKCTAISHRFKGRRLACYLPQRGIS